MKATVLKAHLAANSYDGYRAHHHWMLIAVEPETYQKKILGRSIYPSAEWKDLILDPYKLPWIKEYVKTVGYGFKKLVDPEHRGFYAFGEKGELHDGIDGQVLPGGPGRYIRDVYGTYTNGNGYKPSGEIYEVELEEKGKRYQKLDELPSWYRPTIQKLVEEGTLQGTGTGFDLSEDMVRSIVILERILDKKLV